MRYAFDDGVSAFARGTGEDVVAFTPERGPVFADGTCEQFDQLVKGAHGFESIPSPTEYSLDMKRSLLSIVVLASLTVAMVGCAAEEATAAGMSKCEVCSKEFKTEELHNHGGKLVCATCDSH